MTPRALTFGSVAEDYERFRLTYPDDLVDAVLDHARRPVRTALEIGAGTGKATRIFAARGIEVTATDPDAAMLAELRKHTSASTMRASLEQLDATTTYDLVFAAAALHWTDPDGRWARIAALLVPGGVFASFGGPSRLADRDLESAVCDARQPWLATDEVEPPDATPEDAPLRWPGTELHASDLFDDVRQLTVVRRQSMTAQQYVGLLSTVSAYLELDETARRAALRAIADVLPDTVEVISDVHVHLARRV